MYEDLYAQNNGLLISMARRYAGACAMDRAVSEEDLIQAGFLALVRAAQTYDPAGGKCWAGWAMWHIRREVREAVDRLEDDGQRQVVRLCHLEARSYWEAAALMGADERQVRQTGQRARRWLARDWRLQRLVDLDNRTRFHAHKGVAAFNRDWTSVTEVAALWRIEQRQADCTKC